MDAKTTPSIVGFDSDSTFIGESARQVQLRKPANVVYDSKRMIGKNFDDPNIQKDKKTWPFEVISDSAGRPQLCVNVDGTKKKFFPEQISSMILKNMKNVAQKASVETVTDAVITIPAYFTDTQRAATQEAGKLAGLNVLRIINEPTAASIAFGVSKDDGEDHTVLVFDLGGGTFDVTLIDISDSVYNVRASKGDDHLGGQDFDNRIVEYFASEYKSKFHKDPYSNPRTIMRFKREAEKAKIILSANINVTVFMENLPDGNDFEFKLSRAKFEIMNEDLFERCRKPILEKAAAVTQRTLLTLS